MESSIRSVEKERTKKRVSRGPEIALEDVADSIELLHNCTRRPVHPGAPIPNGSSPPMHWLDVVSDEESQFQNTGNAGLGLAAVSSSMVDHHCKFSSGLISGSCVRSLHRRGRVVQAGAPFEARTAHADGDTLQRNNCSVPFLLRTREPALRHRPSHFQALSQFLTLAPQHDAFNCSVTSATDECSPRFADVTTSSSEARCERLGMSMGIAGPS